MADTKELHNLTIKRWEGSFGGSEPSLSASDGVRRGDLVIDTSQTPPKHWMCESSTTSSASYVLLNDILDNSYSETTTYSSTYIEERLTDVARSMDNVTIHENSNGNLEVIPDGFADGLSIKVNGDTDLEVDPSVFVDGTTITTSSGNLQVIPSGIVDSSTIKENGNGNLEVDPSNFADGSTIFENASANLQVDPSAIADSLTIKENGSGNLEVDSSTIIDGSTVIINANGNIEVDATGFSSDIQTIVKDNVPIDTLVAPADNTNTHVDADQTIHGLMSKDDKSKLDGIEELADVTTDASVQDAIMNTTLQDQDTASGDYLVYSTDNNMYRMTWGYFHGWRTSRTETLTNKTINANDNTLSNLTHGGEVDSPSSGVHGVTGDVVGTTDTQTLLSKTLKQFNLVSPVTITASSGAISVTQAFHLVDGEGSADDTINTINGESNSDVIYLALADSALTLTLVHGNGNITTPTGQDFVIPAGSVVMLLFEGSAWRVANTLGNGDIEKLQNIEAQADVTDASNVSSAINNSTEDSTPADTDKFAQTDGSLAHTTWGTIKSLIQTLIASATQTLTNKTINANDNSLSNLTHGTEVDDSSNMVHGVTGDVVGTSDDQNITGKSEVSFKAETDNGTVSSDTTIDFSQNNNQAITLGASITISFTGLNPGTKTLRLIQDGTGGRTVTFPTGKWEGGVRDSLTSSAGAEDLLTIYYNGTNYYYQLNLDYQTV